MVVTSVAMSTSAGFGCGGRANNKQILHQLIERVDPRHDFLDDRRILAVLRQPRADDLNRAAHARQRVLHFVGDHRRHLAEPGQRRLFAQLLFDPHTRAQVVQNPGESSFAADRHLSHRQVQRKRACRRDAGR